MSGESRSLTAGIESTYKAREVEGILDLYFYRKLGFQLARLAAACRLTPSAVSWIGGLLGMVGGHFYYYADIRLNLLGMALHVGANLFDNADGQLARLTQSQSRVGRILDGFVDHLVWLSVYVHLILRVWTVAPGTFIFWLGLLGAMSHGLQSAAADYYRTTYLHFLKGGTSDNFDEGAAIKTEYRELSWSSPWSKFLLLLHSNHARRQELHAPLLHRLRQRIRQRPAMVPVFLDRAKPAFKWWGFLMNNTRMVVLFAALFLARPQAFFWIEGTILNVFLLVLLVRQERMSWALLQSSGERGTLDG